MAWFGAIQAQDYPAAAWALGQRVAAATEAELGRLFDEGAILRTHVLRPTWHFVLPQDVRWLLRLTGPRIRRATAGRWRRLEIDEATVAGAESAFARALSGGRHLTRRQLGAALGAAGISPAGQRLPHLLGAAELDLLVVSGPKRGRDFTYMLLEDRVRQRGDNDQMDAEQAVEELARRYFRSHGPARLEDFTWWAGLTVGQARAALQALHANRLEIERLAVDGKEYWFMEDQDGQTSPEATATSEQWARLLPNFDEYTVGYRERRALVHPSASFRGDLFSFGLLGNVVVLGGRIIGAWRWRRSGASLDVEPRLLEGAPASARGAIEEAIERLAAFKGRPVGVAWPRRPTRPAARPSFDLARTRTRPGLKAP